VTREYLGSILEKALDKLYIPLLGSNNTISHRLEERLALFRLSNELLHNAARALCMTLEKLYLILKDALRKLPISLLCFNNAVDNHPIRFAY